MIRVMTIEDYGGVHALWMKIKGFGIRSIDDSREGVERFLKRNPTTSVVAVEVAPDLKTAKAYISVLGDEQSQNDTIAGLKSAEGFIRRSLAKSINLRNTPEIRFVLDQSIEYGIHMSKMIDEVTKDLKEDTDE